MLRDEGSMRALLTDAGCERLEGLARLRGTAEAHDQVQRVSCKKLWYSRTPNFRFSVVAVDCGIKHNIIRRLNQKGCNVTIVPYDTTAESLMALRPGVLRYFRACSLTTLLAGEKSLSPAAGMPPPG